MGTSTRGYGFFTFFSFTEVCPGTLT